MNKKVLVIGLKGLPAFGGAAFVGENLLNQLKDKFDFTVLSISSHTSPKKKNVKGIKQIVFNKTGSGAFNTYFYYLKSLFHALGNNYDIIHLHHAESGFITPFLKLKYKVIVTFHGIYKKNYQDPKFSKLINLFFKFSQYLNIKFSDLAISVSMEDKNYLNNLYSNKILYIPNGTPKIDIDNLKYIKGVDLVFAAGRIYEIKGLHLLLKAMLKNNDQRKLTVIGDLDQVPEYKLEILKLSENLNIEFLGLISDKSELFSYIKSANLFIFPSLTEAMSMMLLEVVSLKVPILASDIPANKNIFNEDELIYFKNNDVFSLAKKLNYFKYNPKLLNSFSSKAYSRSQDEYKWDIIAEDYEKSFNKVLN